MAEQYLIDGYNLLYALRSIIPQSNTPSRESLLAKLSGYASFKQIALYVILDGQGDDSELVPYRTKHFQVSYSHKVSADTAIEKYLYDFRSQGTFVVVTADRAISNMARGSGARVMSPEQFWELLKVSDKEEKDHLWDENKRSHGFNRPFDDKLKEYGL